MSNIFDLVVVGGGPGGYVCAIRAAQKGLRVACVEKRDRLGGACLNEGCIPSKVLLDRSHMYSMAVNKFSKYGIELSNPRMNVPVLMKHKSGIVESLAGGIDFLFSKNKITRFKGEGFLKEPGQVVVRADGAADVQLTAKNIVIATGSVVAGLKGVELDGKNVVSSREALGFDKAPESLIVIGAGVIGLELGSVWSRLGSKVTVVEYMDRIVPGLDTDLSACLQKSLESQGITFKFSAKVKSAKSVASGAEVEIEGSEILKASKVLLAVGRIPYSGGIELPIEKDKRGTIKTDGNFETNVKGVFAIGDVVAGPMLAHKAEEEGCAVVDYILGGKPHIGHIPSVIYTHPEVASIGQTEDALKAAGTKYKVGKFPFNANSRAKVMDDTEGFVKVLAEESTDAIFGIHIIGPQAGTLIGEALVAMDYQASSEDIALMCHSHPDLNEALREACLAAHFKPIHG